MRRLVRSVAVPLPTLALLALTAGSALADGWPSR